MWFVGIDVSKATLDVAVLSESGEIHRSKIRNDAPGHLALVRRLRTFPELRVAVEATAGYHRSLVTALQAAEAPVGVLNPAQVSYFVKSQYRRNKTDKADALWIAVYAKERRPAPTSPRSCLAQSLARELHALQQDITRLKNRLAAAEVGQVHPGILASLRRRIAALEQEKTALEEQLECDTRETRGHELALPTAIPGIGTRTACNLLAELGETHRFASARKVVAFAGLTPARFESGSSVRGYSVISRLGSSSLRRILYMPSLSAMRFNPVIKGFFERLVKHNKPRKAAVVACMAKLLRIAYGVLISDKPFVASTAPT